MVGRTYPAIEEKAQRENAEILWTDEVGATADHHPGCGYARQGEPATMDVPRPQIRVNQISALSNEGSVQFMTSPIACKLTRHQRSSLGSKPTPTKSRCFICRPIRLS